MKCTTTHGNTFNFVINISIYDVRYDTRGKLDLKLMDNMNWYNEIKNGRREDADKFLLYNEGNFVKNKW